MLELIAFAGICGNGFCWFARPGMWPAWVFNILIMSIFLFRRLRLDFSNIHFEGIDFDMPDIDFGDISCD